MSQEPFRAFSEKLMQTNFYFGFLLGVDFPRLACMGILAVMSQQEGFVCRGLHIISYHRPGAELF